MTILFVIFLTILSPQQQTTEEVIDSLDEKLKGTEGKERVILLNDIADSYSSNHPERGMDYGQSAKNLSERIDFPEGKGRSLNIIGKIHYNLGDFEKAIQYFLQSLEILKKQEDKDGIANVYNNIGMSYRDISNYDKAMEYHEKALEINLEIDNKPGIAKSYNNIGVCYYSSEKYDTVLIYIKKALDINESINNKKGISSALNNLAICYSSMENYEKALSAFQRSLDINREFGDKSAIGTTLNNIGNLYIHLGDFDKAEEYLEKSADIYKDIGTRNLLKINYEAFANLYSSKGDYKKAIEYYQKYSNLKDSLFSEQSDERIAKMQAIYDLEASERRIALLEKDYQIKKRDNKILVLIIFTVILVAGLLVIIFYTKLKNYRNKQLLLQKEKAIAELQNKQQKERHQQEIAMKNRELASVAMHILQKNDMLNQFKKKLVEVTPVKDKGKEPYNEILRIIDQTIHLDKDWENFSMHFEKVHPRFFEKLQKDFPVLTKKELKQCAYVRLNLSTKEIATLLNITVRGVEKARSRIRVKMNLDTNTDLYSFLQNY
ncbi:MAG: tetratricopeptide repeat protein [Bacteroidales bacterium]